MRYVLYCTVLYCTVLYCTILYLLYLPHPFYIMSFDMILFTFPSFLLTLFSHSILSFESLRFLAHHFINFSIFLLPHCLTILLNIFLILVSTSAPYISSVSVSMLVCVIRISFDWSALSFQGTCTRPYINTYMRTYNDNLNWFLLDYSNNYIMLKNKSKCKNIFHTPEFFVIYYFIFFHFFYLYFLSPTIFLTFLNLKIFFILFYDIINE